MSSYFDVAIVNLLLILSVLQILADLEILALVPTCFVSYSIPKRSLDRDVSTICFVSYFFIQNENHA